MAFCSFSLDLAISGPAEQAVGDEDRIMGVRYATDFRYRLPGRVAFFILMS